MNLKVAARALACVPQQPKRGKRGERTTRGRILCKVINSGRFSPPPLITRTLLLYFVPFHKFGGKNSEFPLLRCSSPFGWRLRWREIGAGHFRRPLIRNFHQGVIRRQGGSGVAEHLVRIGEGKPGKGGRERGFRSSGGRIREGRGERESAVQSPRGSGKPWAPILSRNLSLTAAADGRRTNECTRRNRPRKAPAETRSKMVSKDEPKAWRSMISFAQK